MHDMLQQLDGTMVIQLTPSLDTKTTQVTPSLHVYISFTYLKAFRKLRYRITGKSNFRAKKEM